MNIFFVHKCVKSPGMIRPKSYLLQIKYYDVIRDNIQYMINSVPGGFLPFQRFVEQIDHLLLLLQMHQQ